MCAAAEICRCRSTCESRAGRWRLSTPASPGPFCAGRPASTCPHLDRMRTGCSDGPPASSTSTIRNGCQCGRTCYPRPLRLSMMVWEKGKPGWCSCCSLPSGQTAAASPTMWQDGNSSGPTGRAPGDRPGARGGGRAGGPRAGAPRGHGLGATVGACRYTREKLLAAVGGATMERPPNSDREGVRFALEEQADIFTFTLSKTEGDYSPTTMYRDYAISPDLIHWDSQSTTSDVSPTGQRYINPSPKTARSCSSAGRRTTDSSRPGPSSSSVRPGTSPIRAAGRWRSRGSWTIPCRAEFFEAASLLAG
jgi:hypothetical protein